MGFVEIIEVNLTQKITKKLPFDTIYFMFYFNPARYVAIASISASLNEFT